MKRRRRSHLRERRAKAEALQQSLVYIKKAKGALLRPWNSGIWVDSEAFRSYRRGIEDIERLLRDRVAALTPAAPRRTT